MEWEGREISSCADDGTNDGDPLLMRKNLNWNLRLTLRKVFDEKVKMWGRRSLVLRRSGGAASSHICHLCWRVRQLSGARDGAVEGDDESEGDILDEGWNPGGIPWGYRSLSLPPATFFAL